MDLRKYDPQDEIGVPSILNVKVGDQNQSLKVGFVFCLCSKSIQVEQQSTEINHVVYHEE